MSLKKSGKKIKKRKSVDRHHRAVSLTPGFAVWVAVWVAGLIFTQMLRSPASSIVFGFINAVPVAGLIYALISRRALRIYLTDDSKTAEKNREFDYEFRIYNESILPFPFTDAEVVLPREDSVRCSARFVRISLPPLCDYNVNNRVTFRFRGTYEIGVSAFYVYDFFRIIRVRSDIGLYERVYVLPRRLNLKEDESRTVSDSSKRTSKTPNSYEKIEISDIREYRPGDPLKSVHWKLSSKTEELIVRDYNTGSVDRAVIFADLSTHFPTEAPLKTPEEVYEEARAAGRLKHPVSASGEAPAPDVSRLVSDDAYRDMNEYCADGVVELAVAAVLRELRDGKTVTLVWFDSRADLGAEIDERRGTDDFDEIFGLFATAPASPAEHTPASLTALVSDSEDAKFIFVLPTLDDATVSGLCSMSGLTSSSSENVNDVIVYTATERYAFPEERERYYEFCASQLADNGLRLVKADLNDSGDDGEIEEEEETV
ncbi:MAG: DUF58 domain-containing protein [Clostridia bacterium]|nr:DUF58 domain-containing protein [Clostridia bacterium]